VWSWVMMCVCVLRVWRGFRPPTAATSFYRLEGGSTPNGADDGAGGRPFFYWVRVQELVIEYYIISRRLCFESIESAVYSYATPIRRSILTARALLSSCIKSTQPLHPFGL
jgi:hypothetical protein